VYKDPVLLKNYKNAVGLIRGAFQKKLKYSEALDPILWGRFLAIIDLWGNTDHTVQWRNVRLYYNPITARIEPIANDAYPTYIRKNPYRPAFEGDLARTLLTDPIIYNSYKEALALLVDKLKNQGLLKELLKMEDNMINTLGSEFFLINKLNLENLVWRGECILGKNECGDYKTYPSFAKVYLAEYQGNTFLELSNTVQYDLEIQKIEWFHPANGDIQPLEEWNAQTDLHTLKATLLKRLPTSYKLRLFKDLRNKGYQVRVWAGIKGHGSFGAIIAQSTPYQLALEDQFIPHSTLDEQLVRHPYLKFDERAGTFYIPSGTWHVQQPIVLPEKYGLKLVAGTTLKFDKEAFIFTKGPLDFKGSKTAPITLEADRNSATWKGLVVLESAASSNWSHVIIHNTAELKLKDWGLTGGVSFYKSDVVMASGLFEGARGEDALNIVHSKFQMSNIRFQSTLSDAFDSDFSSGFVKGGSFENIGTAGGGDGIDVSGSVVDVEGVRFKDVSDKALSVGEKSFMKASRLDINTVGIGAASKDASHLEISDSVIKKTKQAGLMAYVKKPEYGPAEIKAVNLVFMDTPHSAKSQKGSNIIIDGKPVATEDIDVNYMYKTVMKSGTKQ
jgi:hypothetical protein